jgi:hypothetical protein
MRSLGILVVSLFLAGNLHAQLPAHTGFAVSSDERGAWSFVTPKGERLVSLGVDNVNSTAHQPKAGSQYYNAIANQFHGDAKAWAASTRARLLDAGFNTLGAWSSPDIPAGDGLYQTVILYVGGSESDRCLSVLRPAFEELVRKNTRETIAKYGHREWLLGVFLDNEMPWYGKSGWDKIATFTLLERAMQEAKGDPARESAMAFLRSRYATPAAMGEAFGRPLTGWTDVSFEYLQTCNTPEASKVRAEFTEETAKKFYETAARVVRQELPGVLILGTRFAGDAPEPVIIECGRACDVVSFNAYVGAPVSPRDLIARYWMLTKKPLMLTEFSWRAKENTSGDPNTRGAGTVLATQAERAANYKAFVRDLISEPVIIGAHWFEFADQSPQGRFDGEDSNYGIVDIHDHPYAELLAAMKETHGAIPGIRAGTLKPVPTEMPAPRKVRYSPGQHPERPATLDLLASPIRPPETWNAPDARVGVIPEGKTLVLDYDTGKQWGGGLNLFGPASNRVARGPAEATDLDGYTEIVVEYEAPKGLQMTITLHEASAGAPGQAKYDTGAGDDGESYSSDSFYATGERTTKRLPIADLRAEQNWGNQQGQRRIDMNAIKTIGIQFQGAPQHGQVRVLAFRLER